MRTDLRHLLASLTSAQAVLHLVSLSAFAVAALLVCADGPGHDATAPELDPPVVRITVFGNVLGEIDLPPAD